jgi:hypothetical protein
MLDEAMNLWQRLRASYWKSEKRRDEIAVEKALLEHEQQERESADTRTSIPAMRNNTDWSGWAGPGL